MTVLNILWLLMGAVYFMTAGGFAVATSAEGDTRRDTIIRILFAIIWPIPVLLVIFHDWYLNRKT